MMQRITPVLFSLVLSLCLDGCQREANAKDNGIDWQSVEPISSTDSVGVIIVLCRNLDRWHTGSAPRIVISFDGSRLVDDKGNEMKMTSEEWKGMVTYIHRYIIRENTPDYLRIRSGPAAVFREGTEWADGHGEITRFWYHIQLIDHENLEFLSMGPVD